MSRFGNGIMKVVENRASIVSPKYWFPIVSLGDLKHIEQHVIAYPTSWDEKGHPTQLYAEIHNPNRVEARQYAFSYRQAQNSILTGQIGELLAAPKLTLRV